MLKTIVESISAVIVFTALLSVAVFEILFTAWLAFWPVTVPITLLLIFM